MSGREMLKENDAMLRGIIRTIDKNVDYTTEFAQSEGPQRFNVQLSLRGRRATVSLTLDDLTAAAQDLARKNTVRQKFKNVRDHMMDNHVVDVIGKKTARMLKESAASQESFQRSNFRRGPRR